MGKSIVVTIFLLSLLIVMAPAVAQGEKYCVTELQDGGGSVERGCFGSLAEAVLVATGGVVTAPSDATDADIVQLLRRQESLSADRIPQSPNLGGARASYVIAIAYDWTNYGGDQQVLTSTLSTGCLGTSYNWTMPPAWDNRVESAQGFANCNNFTMFENADTSGARVDCASPCASFGLLNNQGSRMNIKP